MLRQIAEASKLTVPMMLTEPTSAAAILAFLYMQPDEDTAKGLGVLMREVAGADQRVTLPEIMESVRVPLIYKLALELGDENSLVSAQVSNREGSRAFLTDTSLHRPSEGSGTSSAPASRRRRRRPSTSALFSRTVSSASSRT